MANELAPHINLWVTHGEEVVLSGWRIDLLEAVHRGMDMFDCIIPTQVAKRGTAFTSRGIVELRRSVYKFADAPLDAACTCPVCDTHSRAYLHHITNTQETIGWTLIGALGGLIKKK